MRRILFIDDDDLFRAAIVRALAQEPDLAVTEAPSLDAGLVALDRERPDLIISDIAMPGRLGLEILGELGKRGLSVPIIFLSGYVQAFASQIPRHRDVEIREKPIVLPELLALVRERLAPRESDVPATPFGAADYLQLACLGGHSVEITLHRGAEIAGTIVVYRGEMWSAADRTSRGDETFKRLVFDQGLRAECRSLSGEPPERTLMGKWEALLIDAARERDEVAEATIAAAASDEAVSRLLDEALDAMLRKDHASALKAYVSARAIRPNDPIVIANIRRLHELGVHEESA